MNILQTLQQLRDDVKTWATNNFNALNAKIDEKTIPIDSELSSTSTNPVQNKAIKKAIDNIPTFSGDYNDLTNAPNISEDDSGNMIIADESGNIIFKADADGMHTTAVSINGEAAATEKYVDDAVTNIDIPEVDFTGYATEEFVTNTVDSAKEELSESIVAESDEWKVVDEAGNIIFSVDATGAHTTNLTLANGSAATESYVDNAIANIEFPTTDLTGYATETYVNNKVADLVNSAPEALDTLGELATALENHEDAYDALLETVGGKATYTDLENLKDELSESIVSEANEWKVVDNSGNIILNVDATGLHTTNVTLNGESVEDIIDNAITEVNTKVDNKVDKITGKGLSTNDFTDAYKEKLDGLENITFEESDPTVPAWAKEATKPAYTAEEVGALADTTTLADLTADENHRTVTDAEKQTWNNKSDFSGDYNDLENAPNITEDGSNNLVITDPNGNIIFRSDGNGFETTTLTANAVIVDGVDVGEAIDGLATETYVDTKVASMVDSAPETLNTLNELAAALGNDENFATTVATQIGNKVDKVAGKVLSTNDFTNSYKNKLDSIDPSSIMNYKGEVSELPQTANENDVYRLAGGMSINSNKTLVDINTYITRGYDGLNETNNEIANTYFPDVFQASGEYIISPSKYIQFVLSSGKVISLEITKILNGYDDYGNSGTIWYVGNYSDDTFSIGDNGTVIKYYFGDEKANITVNIDTNFQIYKNGTWIKLIDGSAKSDLSNINNLVFKIKGIEAGLATEEFVNNKFDDMGSLAGESSGFKKIGFTSDCDYIATEEDGLTAFQNAIADATDGDVILVMPGTYISISTLTIDKNINFIGIGNPVIDFAITVNTPAFSWENYEYIGEELDVQFEKITFNKMIKITVDAYDVAKSSRIHAFDCIFNNITVGLGHQGKAYNCIFNNVTFGTAGYVGYGAGIMHFYNCKINNASYLEYSYAEMNFQYYNCDITFANNGWELPGGTLNDCNISSSVEGYISINSDYYSLTLNNCKIFGVNPFTAYNVIYNNTFVFADSESSGSGGIDDNTVLITVDDIDAICNSTPLIQNAEEVSF